MQVRTGDDDMNCLFIQWAKESNYELFPKMLLFR
jgi:hypothetical protein